MGPSIEKVTSPVSNTLSKLGVSNSPLYGFSLSALVQSRQGLMCDATKRPVSR